MLTDMMYSDFNFDLDFLGDGVEYFDYKLYVHSKEVAMTVTLHLQEIETLRENCLKILAATKGAINE